MKTIEKSILKNQKLPTRVFNNYKIGSKWVAEEMANLILQKQHQKKNCILGLSTGSSPKEVYKELIKMHKENGLSFKNVITFNLDEYYPMKPHEQQSYVSFMKNNLFNHIDIPCQNINIPDGTLPSNDVNDYCKAYENKIQSLGGIDLQLLGIGRTGHIGFNEPGSGFNSITRLISLDNITIKDAVIDFNSVKNVPKQAITMGVNTIMQAKRIFLMAWGAKKATIIKKTIENNLSDTIPATYLQKHKNIEVIMDSEASKKLNSK